MMSNCSCNHSMTCGQTGAWVNCGQNSPCNCNCGCVASDRTPACNPWAPWGRVAANTSQCGGYGTNSCGAVFNNTTYGNCGQQNALAVNGGCLVPRIISSGRTCQRRITQTLCVEDLPPHAESPLTLMNVAVSGQATWEQISECRQQLLRVTVPVAVQIRDCAGRCRTGHSTVTLTIPLCMNCPAQDFWRGQLFVTPCIRLTTPVTENDDGCFDAPLEVQAEVYLVRMQVINC